VRFWCVNWVVLLLFVAWLINHILHWFQKLHVYCDKATEGCQDERDLHKEMQCNIRFKKQKSVLRSKPDNCTTDLMYNKTIYESGTVTVFTNVFHIS
jgi:hypothetical protein